MEKLVIIKTLPELRKLREYLADKEYIAFDTETTGIDKESEIIGFSVCADVEVGYYVILNQWVTERVTKFRETLEDEAEKEGPYEGMVLGQKVLIRVPYEEITGHMERLETMDEALGVLQDLLQKRLIMQNATFDCYMVENYFKINLMPAVHTDTMILGHLLNENRSNGLKERGIELYGDSAQKEQAEMKESVHKNGGVLTKDCYELYKADADLIAYYGAKDAILTLKLFYNDVPQLIEEGLDAFFYDDESMPLLRGPTYDLNTTGLRVDPDKLQKLRGELEADCMDARAFISKEVEPYVKAKYPGTGKTNVFNVGASQQRAWLLFNVLGNPFHILTKGGRAMCKKLGLPIPYNDKAKREFVAYCEANLGQIYDEGVYNRKTKKMSRPKKIEEPWKYMACGKATLERFANRYKWVKRYLEYAKNYKLLTTYVEGIQKRTKYGIVRPGFLQHGTTSGRYASRNPNFQNLPRDDKRVKACIISRPGKVFVGADYSQLEPRVFASFSKDKRLLDCFKNGDDFYSVIGMEVFEKYGYSLKKDDDNSFAKKCPELRQVAKVIGLASTYGANGYQLAPVMGKKPEAAQANIDSYFSKFPSVHKFMLESHEQAKKEGRVLNLFGRPRRMPAALDIYEMYGDTPHGELPYEIRNILNLAVNHRVQSTGASIMNRAAIALWTICGELEAKDPAWAEVKLVLQVHDEIIVESPEHLAEDVAAVMKYAMENTVKLPGVDLIAQPKIANNLADLK